MFHNKATQIFSYYYNNYSNKIQQDITQPN